MSISVYGAGRVSPTKVEPPAATTDGPSASTATSTAARNAAQTDIDPATQQPKPLRFPWLSRLSSQLDPVAKLKPPFTAAPVLGDNLDQAA